MATPPIAISPPLSGVDLDGLRTWLLANVQQQSTAEAILGLIAYEFPIYIKVVVVRYTSLPYTPDPSDIPGQQGRTDLLISDAQDPDCLYQHIVLSNAFDFTNTREWIVGVDPLTFDDEELLTTAIRVPNISGFANSKGYL